MEYTHKKGCWIELGKLNNIKNDRLMPPNTPLRIPLSWLKTLPEVAKAKSLVGEVLFKAYGEDQATAVSEGQALYLGSTLITKDGSATLSFQGGHSLFVRPHSLLVLNSISEGAVSNTDIKLESGSVEAKVEKLEPKPVSTIFQIQTPSAIAAVRGTEFRVTSLTGSEKLMRGEVTSGEIRVLAAKAHQDVPKGYGVSAQQGKAPSEPRELLPGPIITNRTKTLQIPGVIHWQAVNGAAAYQLDIRDNTEQSRIVLSQGVTSNQFELPELDTTCYKANLRAIDSDDFQGLDTPFDLCLLELLAVPQIVKQKQSGKTLVSWPQISGADSYIVEFSANPEFSEIYDTKIIAANDISLDQTEQPFYVRVKAQNAEDQRVSEVSESIRVAEFPMDKVVATVWSILFLVAVF